MSTPQVEDWDTIAPTTEKAVVARELRVRHPRLSLREVMADADAIIDALNDWRWEPAEALTEPEPPVVVVQGYYKKKFGLTPEQQIRIEVFRGLLGDGGWPETDIDPVAFFGDFATAAAPFVEWIRTGVEPVSSVGADGAAIAGDVLWAVHVAGPDDVLPMPDRAAAAAKAAEINAAAEHLRRRSDASELDVHISASVVEWFGTAEEHARVLAEIGWETYLP